MQILRATRFGFVILLVAGLALVLVSTLASRGADDDKGVVANLLSRALSTPSAGVSIGSVEGALSSDSTIRDISLSDRDGVWLQVDKARLSWSRSALLFRKLEVDKLDIGTIKILRRPIPVDQPGSTSKEPILPELPLKIEIKDFSLGELALGETVVGVAARVSATGAATLGKPSEGLNLRFDARRLDAAGTLMARLNLVPQTEKLDLKLGVDEPANGVVANALNVPGLPPVKLDLNGSGTLDAFVARLIFDAGASIGADGTAQLRRQGTTRRLALDMKARIEGLLPSVAAPIFSGTTQLNGNIDFADSGAITIAPVSVMSETARLDIQGGLSADQIANLTISARALRNAGDKTAAASTEIGKLVFDATVTGPIMGPTIDATLEAQNVVAPQGKVAKVSAKFNASPSGDVLEKTTSIPFTADAQANGLIPNDPALARALGDTLTLTLAGSLRDGIADLQTAKLRTPTADVRFTGRAGGTVLQGKLAADARDLSRFGGLASLQLRGVLGITADLTGVPNEGRFAATVEGQVTHFGTGIAAVDGLAAGRLGLNGNISKLPRSGYGFGDLRLTGAHATARLDGQATVERANIDVRISIPDLKRADTRLSGRAEMIGKLTGTVDHPDAHASITVTDARALGRPVPRLVLQTTATDLTGMLDARATLTGTVDGKPAQGALRLAKQANGNWRLDDLDLRVGSVTLQGDVALTANRLAEGRLTIDAGNIDDLSPLLLTKMAGQLHADTTLSIVDGGQNGSLSAQARGVKFGTSALDRLSAKIRVTDAYRRPIIDGNAAIDRARIAGESFSQVRLIAEGAAQASTITLTAKARDFALDAGGRLVAANNIRLELSTLTAQRGKRRLTLTRPTVLTLLDDGVDIRALTMTLDGGRLSVNGRAGKTLDLTVNAQSVPLSIADVIVPKLGLSGTLNAEARIGGTTQAPTGNWKLRVDNLLMPQTRNAGLPVLNINASGKLAERRSTIDGTIGANGAGSIRVHGAIPLRGDGLDLQARGKINIGVANRLLSQAGRHITGAADIDFRIAGSLTHPTVDGAAALSGAGYSDVVLGIRYTNISGRIAAHGTQITIERLSAQTPNGGTIAARGLVDINPEAGFPGSVTISGQRAKLIENDIYSAVANVQLSLTGPLARSPTISGTIDIVSLDVTVPERLPTTLRPLAGTVHVAPPRTAAKRLAAQARSRARDARSPAFDAALDLTIAAPNRVFVRGRGIDAELGGDLRVRGRLSNPETIGAFVLRRGRFSIAGTTLDLTHGRILFTGNLRPDLDLVAQTRTGDVTAIITISGSAGQPNFAFSSEPNLPQDEILSRILFSKASGGLSAIQALQLAQVAARFSGAGGTDVFERVRRSLGVDSLDVSVGNNGNPTVGVTRAINRRVSIGVKTGTEAANSGVSIDFDITRNLRLKGEADASGAAAVGVGVEWEY